MGAAQQTLAALGGGVVAYTTLNPADKSAAITLSGGDLVATSTGANSGLVRAVHYKTSGKWYFEAVLTTISGGVDTAGVGIAQGTVQATSDSLGYSNLSGWALWVQGGSGFRNGSLILANAATVQGDVIGFAVDLTGGNIWVSRNGVYIQGDPAAGTSPISTNLAGSITPAASPWNNGHVITMRFDPMSFSYSAPTGFTPGWTT